MAYTDVTLPIEPFVSVGGGILIALVTGGFGLLTVWLNKRLNRIDTTAQTAADLAAPTGNGYAGRTEEALLRIERRLGGIESTQRNHTRDIGGIRQDNRNQDNRLNHLVQRLDHHLDRSDNT